MLRNSHKKGSAADRGGKQSSITYLDKKQKAECTTEHMKLLQNFTSVGIKGNNIPLTTLVASNASDPSRITYLN